MPPTESPPLVRAARELRDAVAPLEFPEPVAHVYNPLDYAWDIHETFLKRFGDGRKRVVFLGMNPGPFGMVQTGVPFGEVAAVRDWMKLDGTVRKPKHEHPKRPVQGLDCTRSEVSGRRLWGLFSERFGTAEKFFRDHFVVNHCPLAFLEAGGRNVTPDKIAAPAMAPLLAACDAHLRAVLAATRAKFAIGVGAYAFQCLERATAGSRGSLQLGQILHPSPASPAANRGWAEQATRQLRDQEVWE